MKMSVKIKILQWIILNMTGTIELYDANIETGA